MHGADVLIRRGGTRFRLYISLCRAKCVKIDLPKQVYADCVFGGKCSQPSRSRCRNEAPGSSRPILVLESIVPIVFAEIFPFSDPGPASPRGLYRLERSALASSALKAGTRRRAIRLSLKLVCCVGLAGHDPHNEFPRMPAESLATTSRPHIRYVAEVNRGPDDFNQYNPFCAERNIVWLHGKAQQYTDRNLVSENLETLNARTRHEADASFGCERLSSLSATVVPSFPSTKSLLG